jgi:hypothetical protein
MYIGWASPIRSLFSSFSSRFAFSSRGSASYKYTTSALYSTEKASKTHFYTYERDANERPRKLYHRAGSVRMDGMKPAGRPANTQATYPVPYLANVRIPCIKSAYLALRTYSLYS